MITTSELLEKAIDFYGGVDQWNKYQTIETHISIGGATWGIKGFDGVLNDVHFTLALHQQQASFTSLFNEQLRSEFSPGRVALVDGDKIIEELLNPRDSFKGHSLMTPWSRLQLVYFASYATWNYLTAPFNFVRPGMQLKEIEPWTENDETFRRLEVLYPKDMAYHSKRQVYYFSEEGYIKRFDYWPDVPGNVPATQIINGYKEFSGIKVGTKRRVYSLNEADNSYIVDPVLVSIDVVDLLYK